MAEHINLNPVLHLTIGAVGEPGQRTFYLQGRDDVETYSVVIEKIQAALIADSLEKLLEDIDRKYPDLIDLQIFSLMDMRLEQPMTPAFRAGQLGMGFNEESGRIVLVVYSMVADDDEEPGTISYWATPIQIRALIDQARSAVSAGRPICGNCGESMDPEGHWCAKRNGHK